MTPAGRSSQADKDGARRILLVDDDELILEVAQMSLEMVGGWVVTRASNGQEGLDRAVAEQPDAIVMDVMMPVMDGPTAAVAMRANPATAHIPVILLTAKANAAERAVLAQLPVAGVLAKPFDPMLLPTELANILGWA